MLAVPDRHQDLAGPGPGNPAAQQIGRPKAEHGQDIQRPLRSRVAQPEPQHLLKIRQAVRAAEVRLVTVEHQPGREGQRLRDDGEIHPLDPAPERQKAEDGGEERGQQDCRGNRKPKTVERLPEVRQFLHLVPHHEVRQRAAIDALGADGQHQVHADRVGTQAEEHPVPET